MHRATRQNAWSFDLRTAALTSLNGAFTVNWVTKSVDHTTKQLWTNWHINNLACALDNVTFLDQRVGTENSYTDIVSFKVKSHTTDTRRELNHLFSHDVAETVNTGNTVTNSKYTASLLDVKVRRGTRDTLLKNRAHFRGSGLGSGIVTNGSSESRNGTTSLSKERHPRR